MAYKSILTVLTNPGDAELAISSAARLARSQDAHLDVLVLGVDRTQVGYSYIGSGAVLMQVGIDRAEAEADRQHEENQSRGPFHGRETNCAACSR